MGYFLCCALQTDPLNTQSHVPVLVTISIKWEIRTCMEDCKRLYISHFTDLQQKVQLL